MRSVSNRFWRIPSLVAVLVAAATAAGCEPTVKIEAPDKPIVINLNVKVEQEVRIKVERDVEKMLENNNDLF